MPDIKTFRAETMSEALSQVKESLGEDALILHTRQIPIKSLIPWQKARIETEIVAVTGEAPAINKHIDKLPTDNSASHSSDSRISPSVFDLAEKNSIQQLVENAMSNQQEKHREQKAKKKTKEDAASVPEKATRKEESKIPAKRFDSEHSKFISSEVKPASEIQQNNIVQQNDIESQDGMVQQSESEKLEEMVSERLDALQNMMESLTQQVQAGASSNIPPELFDVYAELIDSDIEEDLARELITRLRHRCSQEDLEHPERIRGYLLGMVESQIQCHDAIQVVPGQQKIVALVGPTGVGKTTTIAKLAANFRLRDNIRMGLITVDTYRIAAVEQLRTYADIIDLPMKVVTSTREMKQAVEELAEMDLILIDTAGRSPQDELRIQELKNYLSEIVVDEVHLVLSATTGYRNLKKTVEKFSSVNPTSVLFTKLDEAPGLGSLVNVCGKLGHSLSYLTTGQNVPNDIEPAETTRAAKLVLGHEKIET